MFAASSSSFWAIGLLLSVLLFNSLPLINAQPTGPQTTETLASLSEQFKRLTTTVQNLTVQVEENSKVLRQLQNGAAGAFSSSTSTVAGSSASISTIPNNNGTEQSKRPSKPECSASSPAPPVAISTPEEKAEMSTRRQLIKDMTLSAWNAYKQHAWGNATLKPLSLGAPHRNVLGDLGAGSGESIIAALSTLLVMNLTEQSTEALQWVDSSLNFQLLNTRTLLFEKYIAGQLGGLLSAYALLQSGAVNASPEVTGKETAVRQKAVELANHLKKAYKETSLPNNFFNLTRESQEGGTSTLSQAGGQYLEHAYLSHLTGDESYRRLVDRLRDRIKVDGKGAEDGLYDINPDQRRQWRYDDREKSLGTKGREFYYNLLRSYLQSGGRLVEALQLYNEAVNTVVERSAMITFARKGSPVWVRDATLKKGNPAPEYGDTMSYSTCYLGAMFSLGAATFTGKNQSCDPLAERQRWLAVELTKTCRQAATQSPTKMGPKKWTVPRAATEKVVYKSVKDKYDETNSYYLSPELAESYFILWRTTKNPQYREAAWEMARALKRYAQRESGGFAGFDDVTSVDKLKDDQPALFLSATLKYLYLTFTDDDVLPLSKWIFNSAGHPLPICGQHAHLPLEKCKYPISV